MDAEYRLRAWQVAASAESAAKSLNFRFEQVRKALELNTPSGDEFARRMAVDALASAAFCNQRLAELFQAIQPARYSQEN